MKTFNILCANDGQHYDVAAGTTLKALSEMICPTVPSVETGRDLPVLAALVDHKLKGLDNSISDPHEVEFIGYNHPDGRRTFLRSLSFVLQNAVRELYPDNILVIDHSLPSGFYCEIVASRLSETGHTVSVNLSEDELLAIRHRMQEIIDADLPFSRTRVPLSEAIRLFLANKQFYKADLQKSLGRYACSVYWLDGHADSFHGPLVPSTGYLKRVFGLVKIGHGFCLQYPSLGNPEKGIPMMKQSKISRSLEEYSSWCQTTGILGVSSLNKAIRAGEAVKLINLAEARMERHYAAIADMIYARKDSVKIVFIAGPSSSGKTSSSLRIAQQCRVLGLRPKVIELDNYFVSRDRTPRDAAGNYDFECLEAMDLELLGKHLNALLAGEEVEIPRYDFKTGTPLYEGNKMTLGDKDILIMEGIHALDPAMVPDVDNSHIFRVYASALTSLNLDENNNLSTSDNRLLRRMVRDFKYRGHTPEKTILGWDSVRRGESLYIFPFQENADAFMNTALIYELPMLKYYAEPLLRRIPPTSKAYTEAVRLLKFLEYIVALSPEEIAAIPPTSIMREFVGGQTL
ncbi:MAG: nucleoside kinase [Bacteroidales bacterium]|nr:nucleoside kinase [Bacteroidales bacterium]